MKPTRWLLVATLALATVALAAARSGRQSEAVQTNPNAVQTVTGAEIAAARHLAPGDRGATYYWLEGLARRVTVQFPDAIAVTDRGADGAIRTHLTDLARNELATFEVSHAGMSQDLLVYRTGSRTPLAAARRADIHATLDWSGRQAYRLWTDMKAGDGPFEWRDGFMRRAGTPKRLADDDTERITVEFPEGLTATVTRQAGARRHVMTGAMLSRAHVVVSRFTQNGVAVGYVAWYPEEQVLSWDFPNVTTGYLDPTRLKRAGGWTFAPDMAWTAMQGFAFEHFHEQIASRGFVARNQAAPGLPARLAAFFVPSLAANEPGCDDLHWLDGTMFRYCCDEHDQCYEKDGCDASSWWVWWKSWSCDYCNATVIVCFYDAGSAPWGSPWI